MIKVLIAYKQVVDRNFFIQELLDSMTAIDIAAEWNLQKFWDMNEDFDIIHIHWPEFLFNNEKVQLDKLRDTLKYWKRHSKIVVTRHNYKPHESGLHHDQVYDLVYAHADGMIHMGAFSLNDFISKNGYLGIEHTIIRHHIYSRNLNSAANVKDSGTYALVFGHVRTRKERKLVRLANKHLNKRNLKVVVPTWRRFKKDRRKDRWSWIIFKILCECENRLSRMKLGYLAVEQENVPELFGKARIVFIPRIDTLNSGLVTQAISFKKIVVGPKRGNIGEQLEILKNPVFIPENIESLYQALDRAIDLSNGDRPNSNFQYGIENLSPQIIAKQHADFYEKLIKSPR